VLVYTHTKPSPSVYGQRSIIKHTGGDLIRVSDCLQPHTIPHTGPANIASANETEAAAAYWTRVQDRPDATGIRHSKRMFAILDARTGWIKNEYLKREEEIRSAKNGIGKRNKRKIFFILSFVIHKLYYYWVIKIESGNYIN
jgi:hypothetical protein